VSDKTSANAGFTVVELIISISLMGIISVALLAATMNYFVLVSRNNLVTTMTVDSQNLLRNTVEALRYGAGVRQSNAIIDGNGPGGGWNTSNEDFVIIIAVPAIDVQREYIMNPLTGAPYNNELVYYNQDGSLYRRTLAHPDATGNTLRTTCPEGSATTDCPADTKLIGDARSMEFTLYDQDDLVTTDPLNARSVKIDLALERDTFGDPLVLENSIRVTLRNRFL
jgi:prepilin-type N-terminal cleavage/methylation domain-containing protein